MQEDWYPYWQWGQVLSDVAKEPTTNCPGLMDLTALPTSSTMPQYSCPIGVGPVDRLQASTWPQVRSAHAGRREPEDGVRWFDNLGVIAVFKSDVARSVKNCSFHFFSL